MTTKVPAELSSTPSIVDNGDATAVTIDSSENVKFEGLVGINKIINSAVGLSVGADATSTTSYGLEVTNSTANTRFLVNGEGSSFFYKTNNAEGMRFDATSGNLKFASGQGIDFSATADTSAANASVTAELFDDYEEGTWTPTVSAGIISTITGSSEYTKIGDMVFAQTRITGFSDVTSTSQFVLGGLPYSVGTTQSHIGTGWGSFGGGINRPTIFFYVNGGAYFGGTSYGLVRHNDLSAGTNVLVSLIYRHG